MSQVRILRLSISLLFKTMFTHVLRAASNDKPTGPPPTATTSKMSVEDRDVEANLLSFVRKRCCRQLKHT